MVDFKMLSGAVDVDGSGFSGEEIMTYTFPSHKNMDSYRVQ